MLDLVIDCFNQLLFRLDKMIDIGKRIAQALEGHPRKR